MTTKLSAESVKVLLEAIKGNEVEKNHSIDIQGMGPEQIKEFVRPELSDWWWIGDDQIPEKFLPEFKSGSSITGPFFSGPGFLFI